MAAFTKGPWGWTEGNREHQAMSDVFKASDPTFRIGYVLCEFRNDLQRAEDIGNAQLIAQAPSLLDSLQKLVKIVEDETGGKSPYVNQTVREAKKVVEKAIGGVR